MAGALPFPIYDWIHSFSLDGIQPGGTDTTCVFANTDGTRTVLTGTGFTYDGGGHPVSGTLDTVEYRFADGTLKAVANSNLTDMASLMTSVIGPIESARSVIPWFDTIPQPEATPLEATSTLIRIANTDGTFTHIVGTDFTYTDSGVRPAEPSPCSGTTTRADTRSSPTIGCPPTRRW